MKKSLLATVAAVAVIAGPALAQKQDAPPSRTEAPAPAPPAIQNAPAEKVAPAAPKADMPSTTGQATPGSKPADVKGGADVRGGAEMKAGPGQKGDADTKTGSDTRTQDRSGAETRPGNDTKSRAGTDAKPDQSTAQGKDGARTGGSVSLTTEQKSRIRSSVLTSNAPRVTSVNFSVRIGTVVPRSVRLVAVPAPLIEIHPAWRGKMYFVYDDRIVIVEPSTMEIITVVMV